MKIYTVCEMIVDDYKCEKALLKPEVFTELEDAKKHVRGEIAREFTPSNGYENLETSENSYGTVTEITGYYNGGMFCYRIDEEEV